MNDNLRRREGESAQILIPEGDRRSFREASAIPLMSEPDLPAVTRASDSDLSGERSGETAVPETTGSAILVWRRMPKEGALAYQAARQYFEMRASRSLAEVSRKLGKHLHHIERWSKEWSWVDRARAYDEHLDKEEQDAIDKVAREQAAKWLRRQGELAEQKFLTGEKIIDKVNKMLNFPLVSSTTKDGKTTLEPVRWNMKDAAAMSAAGYKLQEEAIREVLGGTTQRCDVRFIDVDYKP
jgi:hypothetical protein